ncbi:conserved hypothetical protein [Enhydrobacter sp. AX1]|nr:DUF262 domain-containing protein [Enhydrobacter sp. AX1]VXB28529.1 conserved hypothetical protein [Enhydrobacter sp. AX1]
MSNTIHSGMLSINEVFEKWFCIPNYQRSYVWEKDQVVDLLDDISSAYERNADSQYFLGSLVLRENKDSNKSYIEHDVLDGQQRLTTLFLISAVIRDLTDDEDCETTASGFIYQKENKFKNIPESLRIVFDIRDNVKKFINEFVKPKGGTLKLDELRKIVKYTNNISIKNMANTIIFAHNYLKNKDFDSLFAFLCNNVVLIYVSTENLDDAFKLFTVLNNRGVKLRNADILKADNLSNVPENLQDGYAKQWEDIESYFGEDFDKFLSHLQSVLVKEKARLSLLDEFEKNIFLAKRLNKGDDFFNFINKYKENYEYLFDTTQDKQLKSLLILMQVGFESDIWIAPLLKYYDKFKEENLVKFVEKLNNKFASDWISQLTPTERIKNMNEIVNKIDNANNSEEILQDTALNINKQELTAFIEGNVYGKRPTRYLLLRLNYLYSDIDTVLSLPETISIEHILPQNPKADSQWKADFDDEVRELWTNKLGNLIILSRRKNSSQSNLDYEKKKQKYFKGNVNLGRSAFIMSKSTWQLDDLQENHKDAVAKLKESFDIK